MLSKLSQSESELLKGTRSVTTDHECHSGFIDNYTIAIKLEGCEAIFHVPKAKLCDASKYFRAALDGGFKEASKNVLKLPGCDQKTFQLFLYWIFHDNIPVDLGYFQSADVEEGEVYSAELQVSLVRLWCFADLVLMPDLQNATMRYLMDHMSTTCVKVEAVKAVTLIASPDSQLYKMIMDDLTSDIAKFHVIAHKPERRDQLGAIPGVMSAVLDRILAQRFGHINSAKEKGYNQYMVREHGHGSP